MDGYATVLLKDMIEQLGEKEVKKILSQFSCPLNKDVEYFLHNTAIELAKQNVSATHLVFSSYKSDLVIVGYFTLANKNIILANNGKLSKRFRSRISKFGVYDPDSRGYRIAAPLIAQIGKNYSCGYNKLIVGDELLLMACNKVAQVQEMIGGKIVYLECEDKLSLIYFYRSNGFVEFGKRKLDSDETGFLSGEYLVQMLKYL